MRDLEKGKAYYVVYRDFASGRIIKTRTRWDFIGTQNGGLFNVTYYVFRRDTFKTLRTMLIPEYCLKETREAI